MKRAVAFCQVISPDYKGRAHKVSSIQIAEMFQKVVEEYQQQDGIEPEARLTCEAEHVDGGMNASEKEGKLSWLKEETPDKTCRVLSNVRCLSEGVDVPALDAVLFLTPRNSQVDVVQSVGRVMRNAPGKKRGYVVLPVVIPAGTPPEQFLDNNQAYKVVWQVLQALRSHDDRFDSMVNKMDLQARPDTSRMEVVAVTQKITQKTVALTTGTAQKAHSSYNLGKKSSTPRDDERQMPMQYEVEGLKHFQDAYPGQTISKRDLFYYVYGILHSEEYRERYADTLRKELPRIPRVKTYEAFKAFSDAGRRLGEMHVNFDSQPIYDGAKVDYGKGPLTPEAFRVEKMKYGKGKDKSVLHYNDRITVTGIPLEAYDYVVNGKPALDWVVERQCVKTDKASGIVNDANDWAIETMNNPRYPLELFLRVLTISLETMKIVKSLPALDILEN